MKKILFLLAMLPMLCFAQKGFEPSVKISYEIPLDKNQSFGADFIAGYRFNETVKVGAGVGVYWCEHLYDKGYSSILNKKFDEYKETAMYVPIYLSGKFNLTKHGISPYFVVDVGYSIFVPFSDYADKNSLGFFVRPAFGVDFPINEGKLFAEVGYKYQTRDWDYLKTPNYSQITVSIGYTF